ncbi:jg18522 [Pararge aegeria aegeria]|uniref:Jg18522 protein n=1 Tax=Pararge aegeria aegeria TaxID=348720 RepID=A0A8S4S1X3_9NEOP|nr:jg18522 [Pararge aegeria aegeria]
MKSRAAHDVDRENVIDGSHGTLRTTVAVAAFAARAYESSVRAMPLAQVRAGGEERGGGRTVGGTVSDVTTMTSQL